MNKRLHLITILWMIVVVEAQQGDHPPDYDYEGFSRGSDYTEKKERGLFNRGSKKSDSSNVDQRRGSSGSAGDDEQGDFELDCGTMSSKKMGIEHYGFGYSMYSIKNPACKGRQGDGHHHFIIEDAYNDTRCKDYVHKMKNMHVYTLDVVIQKHPFIRTIEDPIYSISCNYERSGSTNNTFQGKHNLTVLERKHPRQGRRMKLVKEEGWKTEATVTLSVHDKRGSQITETYLGTWIQLRSAFRSTDATEKSFRLFHCSVQSRSTPDNSYDILLKGCGDGEVIKKTKGFYTTEDPKTPTSRLARSVYFQAFGVPEGSIVTFVCEFIVCSNETNCDGPSCRDSQHQSSGRKRRATDEDHKEMHIARVESPALRIIKPESMESDLDTSTGVELYRPELNEDEGGEDEEDYYDSDPTEEDTQFYAEVTRRQTVAIEQDDCERNWLLIGFLITLSSVCLVLVVCLCCICLMLKRAKRCPCKYDHPYHHCNQWPPIGSPLPSPQSEHRADYHVSKGKGANPIYAETYDYRPINYWASPYKGPFNSTSDQRY